MKKNMYFTIAAAVLLCLGIGFLTGQVTQMSVKTWYTTLEKPFFTPPNWLFAPVWTLLYLMMGVATGRIWYRGLQNKKVKTALYFFGLQILFNGLWSLVFFGLRNPKGGMLVIVILFFLILKTVRNFNRVDRLAALLLYPYLLWVGYASLLNGGIVVLNFA
ncbi:MAG: sensory protein TspO [Flavobacteriaceae bacterium]|nr:sensory protein TspO [Flavobacteriaceae bacterium]